MTRAGFIAVLLGSALPASAQEPEPAGPQLELEGLEDPMTPAALAPVAPTAAEPLATGGLTERLRGLVDRTTLGGYGEHDFISGEGEIARFRNHRYVLFVYSQLSQRLSTSTEIEFEWAGSPLKRDGVLGHGEVLLEFSVVDFELAPWLVFRAGVILMPVSVLNLRHDAPTWDLVDRPIAYETVVPSTWFESGVGLHGKIPLGDTRVGYELYVVNGLDARIYDGFGLRAARGSHIEDNNQDKAVTGRVSVSPWLGLELGASGYSGAYDHRQNRVHLANVDVSLRLGDLELLGEACRAVIDSGYVEGFASGSPANTREAVPTGMQGYYAQANYHFRIAPLWRLFPEDLQGAVFTAAVRYEARDTDMARVTAQGDARRLTLGLNFRPIEAFVVKTDYQWNTRGADAGRKPAEIWQQRFYQAQQFRFLSAVAFLF